MRFVERFVRLALTVAVAVALMLVATYAMASALLVPSDVRATDLLGGGEDADAPAAPGSASEGEGEGEARAADDPAAPSAVAGSALGPAAVTTGVATVTCTGQDGGPDGPYRVEVLAAAPGPEPIVVAVVLAGGDGTRIERRIEVPATAEPAVTVIGGDEGGGYVACGVSGVQQGDRVVLTNP